MSAPTYNDLVGGSVNDEAFQAALRGCNAKPVALEASHGSAEESRRLHLDQLLDLALEASFPASDPPSVGRSS